MKHVVIDCRFTQFMGGLGSYTRTLVEHMLKRDDELQYTLLVPSASNHWTTSLPTERCTFHIVNIPHYSFAEQIQLPGVIHALKPDVYFCPHFNVPLRLSVPFVATVHDLILHRYPNHASLLKQMAYRLLMRNTVRNAAHLIAITQFVADEIVSHYGGNIAPLSVVHEGVGDVFYPRSIEKQNALRVTHQLLKPFFLYVGNAKQHKNVPLLLSAYEQLGTTDTELVLVSGGKELDALTLPPGVRTLSNVDDNDLAVLYSAARAFVTLSLYEGFGLPPVEALACGTPAIVSNKTCLPEVCKGHAQLIEPTVDACIDALTTLPQTQQAVRLWSWEETAERTVEVLKRS